jgi:hypothetical protein
MKGHLTVLPGTIFRRFDSRLTAVARPLLARDEIILLSRDEVKRLEKSSSVTTITVNQGVLWLTGASAAEDVFLTAGEHYDLADHWPYVIQALEPVKISWRRQS